MFIDGGAQKWEFSFFDFPAASRASFSQVSARSCTKELICSAFASRSACCFARCAGMNSFLLPSCLPSLIRPCLASAKIVRQYWWIHTYVTRDRIQIHIRIHFRHLYNCIHRYTYMYLAPYVHSYFPCIFASQLFPFACCTWNIFYRGRRVLRTPPHFCLSKVSATSLYKKAWKFKELLADKLANVGEF